MAVVRITTKLLERLQAPPGEGRLFTWDAQTQGLGVVAGEPDRHGHVCRTFVFQRRGKRITIGRWPAWSLDKARTRVHELIVAGDRGESPKAATLTLAEALEDHLTNLKAKRGSARTEACMRYTFKKYADDWLPRALVTIGREEVRDRHRAISRTGPYQANRAVRYFRAVWNTARRVHPGLPECPSAAVVMNREERRQDHPRDLPAWWEQVRHLPPVRRDFALVCALTGLRSTDLGCMRVEEINLAEGWTRRPKPKGGRPFTIPLSEFTLALLRRRIAANRALYGNTPWVFPGRCNAGPLSAKARAFGPKAGETPHRLRNLFASVAQAQGIDLLTIKMLLGHACRDVTEGYIEGYLPSLRAATEKVTTEIVRRAGIDLVGARLQALDVVAGTV